jgi:hypothetical protein
MNDLNEDDLCGIDYVNDTYGPMASDQIDGYIAEEEAYDAIRDAFEVNIEDIPKELVDIKSSQEGRANDLSGSGISLGNSADQIKRSIYKQILAHRMNRGI